MPDEVEATIEASVVFSRQIDFRASVATLGRWGDDLLDRFDGITLVRTVCLSADGPLVPFAAAIPQSSTDTLVVRAPTQMALAEEERLAQAVAATFATGASSLAALAALAARDRAVGRLVQLYPGHVPVLIRDPFHALVRSISAQQINLRWASVIRARLATAYGSRLAVDDSFVHVLDRQALGEASVEDLRALQLTYAKARAVVAAARAATAGELRFDELARLTDDQVIAHLTRLPGIGRWSAEWFLARTLGRPRVVAGDLGVRKAIGAIYGGGMPPDIEVRRLTEHWGEAAGIAQALALHDLAVSAGRAPAPSASRSGERGARPGIRHS